jgi:hypothetical protein
VRALGNAGRAADALGLAYARPRADVNGADGAGALTHVAFVALPRQNERHGRACWSILPPRAAQPIASCLSAPPNPASTCPLKWLTTSMRS